LNKIYIIIKTWLSVFRFAILLVTIVLFFEEIAILNPVTKTSLNIIRDTIQYGMTSITANEIKADNTIILSARGSKNLP
jgi:hypothetical protein